MISISDFLNTENISLVMSLRAAPVVFLD